MKKANRKTKSDNAGQKKTGISGSQTIASEKSGQRLFLRETHTFNEAIIKFAGK
jgi:hypothetical protein